MQQVDIYERLSKTYNVIIEDNGVSLTKDVIADKSDLLKIVQESKTVAATQDAEGQIKVRQVLNG